MLQRICSSAFMAVALALGAFGCVQRTIEISSEPSGALVHLNDVEVGRTPVEVPFTFYGTYDVRLERAGHAPLWTRREANAPWWDLPGPDLVAELVPGAESRVRWHFDLDEAAPAGEVDTQRLLDHAKQMRARVRMEAARDAVE
ncbi:MAG: PEGA domain-containing protein [Phycisphaeraceae bacterium]